MLCLQWYLCLMFYNKKNIWSHLRFSLVRGWVEPKTWFWHFAWKIGYGCCPLTSACGLWTATSLILPSFTYHASRITYHTNNLQNVKETFEQMKMALHKGFYCFHVIHFWSWFALLFQKLKKVPWFLKKIRVSSLQNISHWSLSLVCCRLNVCRSADSVFDDDNWDYHIKKQERC